MQNDKLLPCPFCGGEANAFVDKFNKYFTGCKKCNFYYGIEIEDGCELEKGWIAIHNTKDEAIKAWNTRKPMEYVVERLKSCDPKDAMAKNVLYYAIGLIIKGGVTDAE